MSALTIQLSSSLMQQLKALVKSKGRTESFYVTKTLEEYLPVVKQTCLSAKSSSRTPEEAAKIKDAIAKIKELRFSRPDGMTIKDMIEEGRA